MRFTRRTHASADPVPPDHERLDAFLSHMGWTSDHLGNAIALGFPELLMLRAQLGVEGSALQYVRMAAARDWLRGLDRLAAHPPSPGNRPISVTLRFPSTHALRAEVLTVLGWTMERLHEAQTFYRFPRERFIEHQTPNGVIRREAVLPARELDQWVRRLRVLVPSFAMQAATDAA